MLIHQSLQAVRVKSEGMIYHHFEGGPKGGSAVAKFNLSWVLGGEKTGDGEVPDWVK